MEKGIKMCENLKHVVDADCSIQYCSGRLVFSMPYKVEKKEQVGVMKSGKGRVGALDPGVCTFIACYLEKECGEIAPGMMARAMKKKIDGIGGRMTAFEREALRGEKWGNREKSRILRRKIKTLPRLGIAQMRELATLVAIDLYFKAIVFLLM